MKKLLAFALVTLMAGTAWAAPVASKKVTCNVNGMKKMTKTAEVCTAMGGTVVATAAK